MTGWLNWQFAALALGIPVAVLTVLGWCCLVVASRADEAAEREMARHRHCSRMAHPSAQREVDREFNRIVTRTDWRQP
jgi:hypothetical protein